MLISDKTGTFHDSHAYELEYGKVHPRRPV